MSDSENNTKSTKELIIENAKKLFKLHGIKKTTIQMIAEECNITKSLLRYYYATKEEISHEIVQTYFTAIYDYVRTLIIDDALLEYMLFIKIYYKNVYNDASVYRYTAEILQKIKNDSISTVGMNYLFHPIIEQYNLPIDDELMTIKMFQISGAHTVLATAIDHGKLKVDLNQRTEQTIFVVCAIFGIGQHTYSNTLKKMYEIYNQKVDKEFYLL